MPAKRNLAKTAAALRAKLAELDQLDAASAGARAPVALDQSAVGRLSRMDALQGQEMALEAQRRRHVERLRIGQALKRIDAGEYGDCVTCGERIEPKRLALDPAVPTCAECAR